MFRVIDWVLQSCGSSLQKAVKSRRFATLLAREVRMSTLSPDSDEGVAQRTGHLAMGEMLNCLPEKQAIEQARAMGRSERPVAEERALIHLCGEEILRAAETCLPESVRQMAERFKVGTAEEQLGIAKELYLEFRSESQEAEGDLSMEVVRRKIERREDDRLKEERSFLPGLYGPWNRDTCPANCQGKTQMLLAFAKLARVEAVTIHPIEHVKDRGVRVRRDFKQLVIEDLTARNLEGGSLAFWEGLKASYYDDRIRDRDGECFHVGVALKLRDGRWVMIDPNGLCWGLIPKDWNMSDVRRVLKKYQGVLPGLTLVALGGDANERLIEGLRLKALDLLHRSQRMGEVIKSRVHNLVDLVEVVYESDDFDLLMKVNAEQTGEECLDLSEPELRRYAVMLIVLGGLETLYDYSAMLDPKFQEKKINSWLTFYHACAMNVFGNRETDAGMLVHPICEVSAVNEWAIAISAINSATWRTGYGRGAETEEYFLRSSFDQTSLYNAASCFDQPIGVAAVKTLKSLRYLHSMCARRIQNIERRHYGW